MKNALLALAALALALLLGECALRVLGLYTPPSWPPTRIGTGIFAPDPHTGYRLYPSTRTCLRYPEEGGAVFEVISNADGLRSARELDAPDPRRRITVLGDSFVFGLGVEEPERLTNQLEALLPEWRVDNVGMSGWGAGEMVRALHALGPKLKPSVVVLAMYSHDFIRLDPQYAGMGYATPKFVLEGGVLKDVPFRAPVGLRRMRLFQAYSDLRNRLDPDQLALNGALFDRFREESLALAAAPVALFLPGRVESPSDRIRREALRAWAERRGVPFADLTAPLAQAGVERVHLPDNSHWNALGHRVSAEALRDLLMSSGIAAPTAAAPAPTAPSAPSWSFCHDSVVEGPEPARGPEAPPPQQPAA